MEEKPISFSFPCLKINQPIGEFYIATLSSRRLYQITWFDVRRIFKERDVETYLGIQRPLNSKRVKDIAEYVNTIDACFPTAVILAISGKCVSFDDAKCKMTLSNYVNPEEGEEAIYLGQIAKVLDGQHRIEGLKEFIGNEFDINVSIFVDIDIAEQAYLFSTVNLSQTKVSKSLVYDLYDLAKARSPQKVCHMIAVALDSHEKSPLYKRIKRLGKATEGRYHETITQATFVESLIRHITNTELKDRDLYMRGQKPKKKEYDELENFIFANMMIEEKDLEITDTIWNYFEAVKVRWPKAWNSNEKGLILNKTNGFRSLMRFLRVAYLKLTKPGGVPSQKSFLEILNLINLSDEDFNTVNFKPGSSGEAELYKKFLLHSGLG